MRSTSTIVFCILFTSRALAFTILKQSSRPHLTTLKATENWLDVRETKLNPGEAIRILESHVDKKNCRVDRVLVNAKLNMKEDCLFFENDLLVQYTDSQSIPMGKRLVSPVDPIMALQVKSDLGWVFVDDPDDVEPLLDILSVSSLNIESTNSGLWVPNEDALKQGGVAFVCSTNESLMKAARIVATGTSNDEGFLIPNVEDIDSESSITLARVLPLDMELWSTLLELESTIDSLD